MKISILICSLESRQSLLCALRHHLGKRKDYCNVEVLIEQDNGEITIGAKRNKLLDRAKGDYICFIDDDDMVSNDYVEKILKAIETKPDCCSLQGEISFPRRRRKGKWLPACKKIFKHSKKYSIWFEKEGVYYRCPNHLNVVKRELALKVGFPLINQGEDRDYSFRLYEHLKTEVEIPGTIYFYRT